MPGSSNVVGDVQSSSTQFVGFGEQLNDIYILMYTLARINLIIKSINIMPKENTVYATMIPI